MGSSINAGFFQGQSREISGSKEVGRTRIEDAEFLDKKLKEAEERVLKIESVKKTTAGAEDYIAAGQHLGAIREVVGEVRKAHETAPQEERVESETFRPN